MGSRDFDSAALTNVRVSNCAAQIVSGIPTDYTNEELCRFTFRFLEFVQ
jgi:hypothetical protein